MKLVFKKIEKEDITAVLALFKETAEKISKKNIDHWQYWKNPPADKVKWVEDGIDQNEFFFIQSKDKEDIGMVRILDEDELYWGKQDEKAKYIHSLVVREVFNGKGYGGIVLEMVENFAKNDNCLYLRLDADSENPKLCNYYEQLGFMKVGTKKMSISIYNLYQKELK
jgi:ribosomal protein S18 acetylase RimI-like enzyme